MIIPSLLIFNSFISLSDIVVSFLIEIPSLFMVTFGEFENTLLSTLISVSLSGQFKHSTLFCVTL